MYGRTKGSANREPHVLIIRISTGMPPPDLMRLTSLPRKAAPHILGVRAHEHNVKVLANATRLNTALAHDFCPEMVPIGEPPNGHGVRVRFSGPESGLV